MSNQIFEAIRRHDVAALSELLTRGDDPDQYLDQAPFWHPLEAAIEELERGASLSTVMNMVKALLQYGANVNAWDPEHTLTPLLKAIYFPLVGPNEPRATDLIYLLLEFGADPNVESDEGLTPLKYAVALKDAKLVAEMLSKGANKSVNKVTGGEGWNALHLATADINADIISLLLDAGADPDIPDTDHVKPVGLLPKRNPANHRQWGEAYALLTKRRAA